MPVLLDEEEKERWLTRSFDDAVAPAKPYPSQLMSDRSEAVNEIRAPMHDRLSLSALSRKPQL
jgi:putative SOS response-associated peptidase YedK